MSAALIAAALGLCVVAGSAGATIINFAATIDGAQETPPIASPAMATGTFVMDTVADTLSINIVILVPPLSGEIGAHIHGFAPPGVPAGILFALPLGSPKIAVWNFAPGDEANIIAGLTYANIHSNDFVGGEIRGQILRVPSCGDGFVDLGEQCDDGNNVNGDCCDATCQAETAGNPCTGSGLCNASGVCDGAGACAASPLTSGCKSPGKAIVLIKNNGTDNTKDKLIFKWLKGAQTDLSELGVPTGTTAYALCLYAGTTAIATADVPASTTLWKASGSTGFKYKDPTLSEDGILKIVLKSGVAGKSKAIVKGKGDDLPDPPAGQLTLPVTAQLLNSEGLCLEGVFNTATKNESDQFKAKTP